MPEGPRAQCRKVATPNPKLQQLPQTSYLVNFYGLIDNIVSDEAACLVVAEAYIAYGFLVDACASMTVWPKRLLPQLVHTEAAGQSSEFVFFACQEQSTPQGHRRRLQEPPLLHRSMPLRLQVRGCRCREGRIDHESAAASVGKGVPEPEAILV